MFLIKDIKDKDKSFLLFLAIYRILDEAYYICEH